MLISYHVNVSFMINRVHKVASFGHRGKRFPSISCYHIISYHIISYHIISYHHMSSVVIIYLSASLLGYLPSWPPNVIIVFWYRTRPQVYRGVIIGVFSTICCVFIENITVLLIPIFSPERNISFAFNQSQFGKSKLNPKSISYRETFEVFTS